MDSPQATFSNLHSLVPKNSTMTTMQTPFTLPSPFTYSAPPAARVAFLPKLPKRNKKMQELPKSPSSLVFYSLSSSALPTVLTTPMHGKAGFSLNCVFHSFLAMMHNSLKPSHFLSWIWNTPFICLSPLPGLFSRLVQVPLYRQPNTLGWAGLDSQLPNFTRSAEETIDFSPLSCLLHFLPHFLPSTVKPLIQHYLFDDQLRYDPACFDYLNPTIFSLELHLNL